MVDEGVGNVVAANLLAMTAAGVSGEVFNIGCGQQSSLNELARQLGQIAGAEPQVTYLPARGGDILHSLADISKARALLGYEPAVWLGVGLQRTWEYFAAQRAEIPPSVDGSGPAPPAREVSARERG